MLEESGGPPEVRKGLREPPVGPGRVGRPTQIFRMGREANSEVRERSGGPHEGPGGPPGGTGQVGNPTQTSGRDRETHPKVTEESGAFPVAQKVLRGPPVETGGVGSSCRWSGNGQ